MNALYSLAPDESLTKAEIAEKAKTEEQEEAAEEAQTDKEEAQADKEEAKAEKA